MLMCQKEKEGNSYSEYNHYFDNVRNPNPEQKCLCGKYTIKAAMERSSRGISRILTNDEIEGVMVT